MEVNYYIRMVLRSEVNQVRLPSLINKSKIQISTYLKEYT